MKFKESYFLFACVLIILIYLSPYLIWGQNCRIEIGDNLDSNVPWLKVMADNVHHLGWNYDVAPQVMNGIPKMCLGSQLNVIFILYLLFPPFIAYVANLYAMHFIAFAGMVLLLKKIIPKNHEKEYLVIYGTALCFALLDFWPSGGLSIAGQPLLLYAFLNIKGGNFKPWNFAIIMLFPFYSGLVLSGVFLILFLCTWIVHDLLFSKRNHLQFYLALLLLIAFYGIAEYELFKSFLFPSGFVSHRVEFYNPGNSLWGSFIETVKLELYGLSSHANVFQFPMILAVMLSALLLSIKNHSQERLALYYLILISLAFSFLSGFYHWVGIDWIKTRINFVKTFDLSRFSFLLPVTFYLILFYCLLIVLKKMKGRVVIIVLLLFVQIGLEFKRNASDLTLYNKIGTFIVPGKFGFNSFSYRQYYSENLFSTIKNQIGLDPSAYRVVGLGLDPGILLFNGFYTLDAYVANYPLAYKKKFRKIIAGELAKNEAIRKMFDHFGSTCYLYSSEIGTRTSGKIENLKIQNLQLDHDALRGMGCDYLISAVEIKNHKANNLVFWRQFDDPASMWRIYVYKV